jgi:signal transduction histidine kinase
MNAPALAGLGGLAEGSRRALEVRDPVADPVGDGPSSRAAGAIAMLVAGAVSTAATVALVAGSEVLTHPHPNAVLRGLAVALCVAVGAYTWWRRPESRLGLLVAGMGLSFSLTSLMAFPASLPFTLGRIALAVFVVFTVYVFACFPRDHLGRDAGSWFIRALAIMNTVLWALALAVTVELPVGGPVAQCADRCPGNALRFVDAPTAVSDVLTVAVNLLSALALAGVTLVLVVKACSPDRLRRRAVEPLLWAMSALALAYAAYITLRQTGVAGTEVPGAIVIVAFLSLPVGMLVGQIRGRIFAATRLGRLVVAAGDMPVTPERVQSLIADALGDPTLKLVLWSPEHVGYVDVSGAPVHLPSQGGDRTAVPVTRDGRRVAAVVHDRALDQGQGMTEGVAATALVLLDNARLVEELSASRTRIAETAQRERARLERDLHDGAQQRLVAIQIKLSLLRELEDPGERDVLFDEVEGDATAAVEELHDLAHGIFPSLLGDRGLAAALRSVARSAPMPVSVRSRGTTRYAPATEAAVYFSVLEALQNAMKHAGSTAHVELSLDCFDGAVTFAVADRGNGFDVGLQSAGLGLVSMRDRMAAVGGTLVVSSTPGGGTTVSGRAPARRENQEALG